MKLILNGTGGDTFEIKNNFFMMLKNFKFLFFLTTYSPSTFVQMILEFSLKKGFLYTEHSLNDVTHNLVYLAEEIKFNCTVEINIKDDTK